MKNFPPLLALFLLLALAGCAGVGAPQGPVSVLYATDRLEVDKSEGWFGMHRHETAEGDGIMSYGRAVVRPGKALKVEALGEKNFLSRLKGQRVLVVVHGYRMDFAKTMERTAEVETGLGYPGAVVAFSWPSRGTTLGYTRDATNAAWAAADLEAFLLDATQAGASVDILSHSMGAAPTLTALSDIAATHKNVHFNNIVFAAPDVDADLFRRALPQIAPLAHRVTLYASSKDEALKASRSVNGYRRAGDANDGIVTMPGLDTVDASSAGLWLLGHGYYRDPASAMMDISALLRDNDPPASRAHLKRAGGDHPYWIFTP